MAFNSLVGSVMSKINNLTIIVKCQSVLSLLIMHLCQYTWLAPWIYLCVICSSSAYKNVSECWKCTAGFHCSQPGRDSPVGPCDPGYYCPSGASSSQEVPCYPGTYCVGKNEEPELCPIGTFQPNNTRTHVSDCINCTAGRFF